MKRLLLLAAFGLIACQDEEAKAPDPMTMTREAVSHFCLMQIDQHPGPKAQIHVEGFPDPIFFAQVRDALAYVKGPERDGSILAFYVSDMGIAPSWESPGKDKWIPAGRSHFVVDSNVAGGMGAPEIVPFADPGAARDFASRKGGRVMLMEEIPRYGARARRCDTRGGGPVMTFTRRRFLTISAAAAAMATSQGTAARAARAVWRGVALGAPASVVLAGITRAQARPVLASLEDALHRLECIFSLYRDQSAISRLNRDGLLHAPPPEMLEVLSLAGALHDGSDGAFDPTVQPLWQALAHGGDTPSQAGISGIDGQVLHRVALSDRALATSAPEGTVLEGGQGHILNPAGTAPRQGLVSVSASSAVLADGLSTALCLLDRKAGRRLVDQFGSARIEVMA